jgi:hypothetical protein
MNNRKCIDLRKRKKSHLRDLENFNKRFSSHVMRAPENDTQGGGVERLFQGKIAERDQKEVKVLISSGLPRVIASKASKVGVLAIKT